MDIGFFDRTTPISQRLERLVLENSGSRIIPGSFQDITDTTENGFIHNFSHVYILPPGLSTCVTDIVNADGSDPHLISQIKIFEIDFRNYKLHDSVEDAYAAYELYAFAKEGSEAQSVAAAGYFNNPS